MARGMDEAPIGSWPRHLINLRIGTAIQTTRLEDLDTRQALREAPDLRAAVKRLHTKHVWKPALATEGDALRP